MKRIRNPDTGRFHTPEEAFEALMEAGCLVNVDLDGTLDDGGKDVGIIEVATGPSVRSDHPAMKVFRAAVPVKDENEIDGLYNTWVRGRMGFDYYCPLSDARVKTFARLWDAVKQLHS